MTATRNTPPLARRHAGAHKVIVMTGHTQNDKRHVRWPALER